MACIKTNRLRHHLIGVDIKICTEDKVWWCLGRSSGRKKCTSIASYRENVYRQSFFKEMAYAQIWQHLGMSCMEIVNKKDPKKAIVRGYSCLIARSLTMPYIQSNPLERHFKQYGSVSCQKEAFARTVRLWHTTRARVLIECTPTCIGRYRHAHHSHKK